jgi:oxygen-independent coproporphyrinogen III oxidase
MAPLPPDAPVGIYLHIPFCQHVCPYCDFNTYGGQEATIPRYVDALVREIHAFGERHGRRAASSVFFGGGTPSLLTPEQVARILDACRIATDLANDAEITLEANPNAADRDRFAGYRAAGVNRLSIGVQTTRRRGLRALGRNHEQADAEAAFVAAREAGFTNVSLDLIFGWPGQDLAQLEADIDTVLGWSGGGPDHLSLYHLIVEPGTPMADAVERGILRLPDDDAAADLYDGAIATMAARGWTHYEVANWVRDPALISRHNALYWRNGEYAGLGAGAHGRIGPDRAMQHLLPATWMAAVERGDAPISNIDVIDDRTAMGETMMLGLRLLLEGVTDAEFLARHDRTLVDVFGGEIRDLVDLGMLLREPDRVRLTPRGLLVANDVVARFLPDPDPGD